MYRCVQVPCPIASPAAAALVARQTPGAVVYGRFPTGSGVSCCGATWLPEPACCSAGRVTAAGTSCAAACVDACSHQQRGCPLGSVPLLLVVVVQHSVNVHNCGDEHTSPRTRFGQDIWESDSRRPRQPEFDDETVRNRFPVELQKSSAEKSKSK